MEEKKDIAGWLHLVPYPAFYVTNDRIELVNPAAESMMVRPGTEIRELIQTGMEEYRALGDACLCLTLTIAGVPCNASVTRMGEGYLFRPEQPGDREEFRALALASTELRLPLNNVLSLTEQLLAEAEGDTKDKASRMNRSLYQMLRILGNMSDAGQISAGYRPSLHNIPVVIGEIFGKAQALIPHAGITLTYKGLDELVLGLADADQLERAIFNILSNAMKFTPAGGTLSAELVRSGKLLRLTIQDSGSGIARKVMDTLFCRYLREPGIEDSRHGLGLGMPLIRAVAANHGGTVLIDRFAENGTRITMTITIRQTEGDTLRSPWKRPDYAGERNHALVELSDCLPAGLYGGTE